MLCGNVPVLNLTILLISLSIESWFLGQQEGLDQKIIETLQNNEIVPGYVIELVQTTF